MTKSRCLLGSSYGNPLLILHTWSRFSKGVTTLPLELDLVTMDPKSRFGGKWVPIEVLYSGLAYENTSLNESCSATLPPFLVLGKTQKIFNNEQCSRCSMNSLSL